MNLEQADESLNYTYQTFLDDIPNVIVETIEWKYIKKKLQSLSEIYFTKRFIDYDLCNFSFLNHLLSFDDLDYEYIEEMLENYNYCRTFEDKRDFVIDTLFYCDDYIGTCPNISDNIIEELYNLIIFNDPDTVKNVFDYIEEIVERFGRYYQDNSEWSIIKIVQ